MDRELQSPISHSPSRRAVARCTGHGNSARFAVPASVLTDTGLTEASRPFSQWVLSVRPVRDPALLQRELRLRRSLATVATLLLLAGLVLLADPGASPPKLGLQAGPHAVPVQGRER